MNRWILFACASCAAAPAHPEKAELQPSERSAPPESSALAATPPPEPPAIPPPLPKGTVVLHVGDSLADALGKPLKDELQRRGIESYLAAKESTYIPEWAGFKMQLDVHLARRNPDLVLITLGGNELQMPIPSQRIGAIERIVKKVGDRPCLWIAVPAWPPDKANGLLEVIRQHCAPCIFVDTNALIPDLKRLSDGVHPTIPERTRWAQFMIRWMLHNRDPSGDKPWSFKSTTEPPPPESEKWLDSL